MAQDRREIFKDLKAGEPAPVYFLHGQDPYMLRTAIDAVIEAALPEGRNEFNFQKFRANEATAEAIRSAADTLPFMTRRRVVVVENAEQMNANELDGLKDYFVDPAPTTVLIVASLTVDKKLDGRSAAVKALKKVAAEYEFKELRDYEVAPILERNAKGLGFKLDRDAAAYLVDAVGTDLATLMTALEKIDIYLGPDKRTATRDDVQDIVSDTRVKSIFDLTNAVGARKFADALKILDRMLMTGESAIGVTAMFARHFRIVAKLHDRGVARLNKNDVAKALGVSPFFLKDYEADARRFQLREVERIRRRLTETDLALKSSPLKDRIVMEALLLDICSRDGAAV